MWSGLSPMIPHQYFFWALLLVTCGYALWRGRSDERLVALVCVGATVATRFAISPMSVRYTDVETGLLIIDLAVLAGFIAIALRSHRFWPLWVAGLQLTNSMAHLMKAVEVDLMPFAYGAAAALWSYPILMILAVGTWRGQARERGGATEAAA
ncbi:MAG TPA: hypothetical protein VFY95_01965 [Sphingomicrobium sp.]